VRRSLIAVILAIVLVPGGCGGSDKPDLSGRLREVTNSVEAPLHRLDQAVANARPSKRSSMVTLRAAAGRARDALSDARRELRGIEDQGGPSDRSRVREIRGVVSDVQALADALAVDQISVSALEAAGERARQAVDEASTDLPTIDVARLASAIRKHRRGNRAKADGGISKPVGGGSTSSSLSAGLVSYFDYSGPAFQAKLPTGSGWAAPAQSEPTPDRLFRTSVRGPNGLFVIIDYTPYEPAVFGGRYSSRSVVGQTAFGRAIRYVFQGGSLPECQRSPCVDYIINDPSREAGFGVLAGGSEFATAADVAQTVAESVTPAGD
jgi:hypothetical protein